MASNTKGLIRGRWKPGESGNPMGGKKPFIEAVRRVLLQEDPDALRDIARKLIKHAREGKPWAVELLCERLDGKAPQEINFTRSVREMSIDELLAELAETRSAAGDAGEGTGEGEPDQVH